MLRLVPWIFAFEELYDPGTGAAITWKEYPSAIQLAVDVPAGATTVTVDLEVPDGRIALDDLVVHVGVGAPVVWAASSGALTVQGDATFSAASPIVLDGAAGTLYLSVASQGGRASGFVEVRATVEP